MGLFHFKLSKKARLITIIGISFAFFLAEITTGFYTHSLALVADAFHYLFDLIGYVVQLVGVWLPERKTSPQNLSFGWARTSLLGAFFNGVFLLALSLSIIVQAIERFISIERVENPKIILIVGCVGLFLNIISIFIVHEHDHGPGGHSHGHGGHSHAHVHARNHEQNDTKNLTADVEMEMALSPALHDQHLHLTRQAGPQGKDLGMLAVLMHVACDALNNVAVIVSAIIMWLAKSEARFYADPSVSLFVAIMILAIAVPVVKRTGVILLQSAPPGVRLDDVKHDLELLPGVHSVHELHVWRLDQNKAIASAHVVVSEESLGTFMKNVHTASECFHQYGIHSATLQPELLPREKEDGITSTARRVAGSIHQRAHEVQK